MRRTVSRWTLARRLQDVAMRIAAGKPVRVGGASIVVPDRVVLEEELELSGNQTELEFEVSWRKAPARTSKGRRSVGRPKKR